MPYIERRYLDCAIYLYPSVAAAEQGKAAGGTGFLVNVPSLVDGYPHLYAVTNEHVIRPPSGAESPVVRLNARNGGTDILPLAEHAWLPHPKGDDLAATALVPHTTHDYDYIDRSEFLMPEDVERYVIGPGDDCFMVGRFVFRDGTYRNTPVLRFGNIAMMPDLISQFGRHGKRDQFSYIVEMRSISGFSGSAVMVYYTTYGTRGAEGWEEGTDLGSLVVNRGWLLGVDWGHLPAVPNLLGDQTDRKEVNSGMSAVVPAWKLAELLDREEFKMVRDAYDSAATKAESEEGHAVMDHTHEAPQFNRFEELTRRLLQVPKKEVDDKRAES